MCELSGIRQPLFRSLWPYFVDNRVVEECSDYVTESPLSATVSTPLTTFTMAVQLRCGLVLLCPSLDPRPPPPHQPSAAPPPGSALSRLRSSIPWAPVCPPSSCTPLDSFTRLPPAPDPCPYIWKCRTSFGRNRNKGAGYTSPGGCGLNLDTKSRGTPP